MHIRKSLKLDDQKWKERINQLQNRNDISVEIERRARDRDLMQKPLFWPKSQCNITTLAPREQVLHTESS